MIVKFLRVILVALALLPVAATAEPIAAVAAFIDQTKARSQHFSDIMVASVVLFLITALAFGVPGIAWYRRTREKQQRTIKSYGVNQDITKRKQAEDEIVNLSRFPQDNPNPVLRFSPDGTIIFANVSAQPLLNLWGREVGQLLPDDWVAIASEVLSSGVNKTVDVTCSERVYSITLSTKPAATSSTPTVWISQRTSTPRMHYVPVRRSSAPWPSPCHKSSGSLARMAGISISTSSGWITQDRPLKRV